eukprot:scaffold113194_cov21-Tisochrysis_lutea.AAC.1
MHREGANEQALNLGIAKGVSGQERPPASPAPHSCSFPASCSSGLAPKQHQRSKLAQASAKLACLPQEQQHQQQWQQQ